MTEADSMRRVAKLSAWSGRRHLGDVTAFLRCVPAVERSGVIKMAAPTGTAREQRIRIHCFGGRRLDDITAFHRWNAPRECSDVTKMVAPTGTAGEQVIGNQSVPKALMVDDSTLTPPARSPHVPGEVRAVITWWGVRKGNTVHEGEILRSFNSSAKLIAEDIAQLLWIYNIDKNLFPFSFTLLVSLLNVEERTVCLRADSINRSKIQQDGGSTEMSRNQTQSTGMKRNQNSLIDLWIISSLFSPAAFLLPLGCCWVIYDCQLLSYDDTILSSHVSRC
ncbi:uncharacterized protein [Dendropsophus ebraccatus]|uniref:uncharacterized protein n=1 Tax=Dendropsophus ebraccatus TaxID=150705 RepID=UPI00383196C5